VPITRPWESFTWGNSEEVHDGKNEFVRSCNHAEKKIAMPITGSAVRSKVEVEGMFETFEL
jgi:hypothetical protein